MNNFLLLAQNSAFMPSAASETAQNADLVYIFLLVVSLIAFVGVIFYIIFAGYKYRRRSKDDETPNIRYHIGLEIAWTVIPLVVFLFSFVIGAIVFSDLREYHEGDDVVEIHVTARQWSWTFEYSTGYKITSPMSKPSKDKLKVATWGKLNEPVPIPLPVNKKIRFVLTSQDVLHSFFLPNFRNKMDAIPGTYTYLSIEPTQTGDYVLYCTEFCGTSHSNMMAVIRIVPQKEYDDFIKQISAIDLSNVSLDKLGKSLYVEKGCNACHTVDGSAGIGPTYKGSFGSMRDLEDGTQVLVDENYIRNSILNPQSQISQGYPPVMNSYNGLVTEDEIKALTEYIKTLK